MRYRTIIILGILAIVAAIAATQTYPVPDAQANSKVKALQSCMASCRARSKACYSSGNTGACQKKLNACFASCQSSFSR